MSFLNNLMWSAAGAVFQVDGTAPHVNQKSVRLSALNMDC